MVLQNRHPLPYRGEYDPARQTVFTRRVAPPPMPSIVVLPLLVHERPLGTLVLGSRRRAAFNDAARSTLEVLASHMAVSLTNARMLRRLEELATMDGLTGLLNKRAMLEVAEQKIAAAKRFGRHLSVLVTDIDHFKKVNDTYGHDVGDVVIKGLGEILRRAKRNTDAVARFGGEEFVVICEETDARGAMLLAERIREELARTTFHPQGKVGDGRQAARGERQLLDRRRDVPRGGRELGGDVQGRGRGALRLQALRPRPLDGVEPVDEERCRAGQAQGGVTARRVCWRRLPP